MPAVQLEGEVVMKSVGSAPTLVLVAVDSEAGEPFVAWKILTVAYGSEGCMPQHARDCPYSQEHGDQPSCVSGSGGSLCGGFMGGPNGYVYCVWGLY